MDDEIIGSIKKFIEDHNKFLIVSHINPEGDSIGSQLAFTRLLKYFKKDYIIFNDTKPPKLFNFFDKIGEIKYQSVDVPDDYDACVILDCPVLKRIGKVTDAVKKAPILNIDHHVSNNNFGSLNWVEPRASSSGEMVYGLFKEIGVPLDKESALYIYVAILTDTGSFRYENTSSETHKIAGELIALGVKPTFVSERLFETKSLDEILLLGEAISTLKLYFDRKACVLYTTREMLKKFHVTPDVTEQFINFARSVDGVEVAVFIREDMERNMSFVSFRSKGKVDVNDLAKTFGGGGHINASGCVIKGRLGVSKKIILNGIKKFLKEKYERNTFSK